MIFLMGINIIINENKILIFNNELNCKQFPDRIEVNDGEKNIILRDIKKDDDELLNILKIFLQCKK